MLLPSINGLACATSWAFIHVALTSLGLVLWVGGRLEASFTSWALCVFHGLATVGLDSWLLLD